MNELLLSCVVVIVGKLQTLHFYVPHKLYAVRAVVSLRYVRHLGFDHSYGCRVRTQGTRLKC
jgi:hypothetical protein